VKDVSVPTRFLDKLLEKVRIARPQKGGSMSKRNWWKTACAVSLLCAVTAIASPAQTFTTLHSFDGAGGDGPYGALVQATDGDLYGTTVAGGSLETCDFGCGTVFKISPAGTLATLYSFCSQGFPCTDGASPYAALIQADGGNFYSTAYNGGANDDGTIFEITPNGSLTTLHSFDLTDGAFPYAALIQAADGDFYGTTPGGGVTGSDYGTIFEITPEGTLTTLHSFCSQTGCPDGGGPTALVEAIDGNLYGTTSYGGASGACTLGCGTVFKITPGGTFTSLHSFSGTDGSSPGAALVQATDGSLYGTTESGGASTSCTLGGFIGCGTIFKITSSGTLTTLYSFCSQSACADGEFPAAGLVQATAGNLYGTTPNGGANGYGTVFKMTRSGTLTTLYSFCSQSGCADSESSYSALIQVTNGKFYGTTGGGANGLGAVFGLSVGLGPFVKTQPISGKVGKPVIVLGTSLTAATSVTFNGTAAAFRVVSKSAISTTVPAGVTTGTVQVVTPVGTLSSNVPFRVAP
jgi:uncharacterized repeat protein (TIGR03803 family)